MRGEQSVLAYCGLVYETYTRGIPVRSLGIETIQYNSEIETVNHGARPVANEIQQQRLGQPYITLNPAF